MTYSITPLIRINWDGETSGYAENPDNFSLKIGYTVVGSPAVTIRGIQYVPASKPYDQA